MKINYEVLRQVMINFQDAPLNPNVYEVVQQTIEQMGCSQLDAYYAVKQSIDEGLLSGKYEQTLGSNFIFIVSDITPYGHRFIDSISPTTSWNKVKNELVENGIPITIPSISRAIAKFFFNE